MKIPGIIVVIFTIVFVLIGLNLEAIISFITNRTTDAVGFCCIFLTLNMCLAGTLDCNFNKNGIEPDSDEMNWIKYSPLSFVIRLVYLIYYFLTLIVKFINKHLTITI